MELLELNKNTILPFEHKSKHILQLAVKAHDQTHISLVCASLEMTDAVDKNMAGLRSSQALPIFSLFNSSSLLPAPASLVTHYRGVADGFPLTQQKTGWNCVHVCVCVFARDRETNILPKLLSTMNFDVYS